MSKQRRLAVRSVAAVAIAALGVTLLQQIAVADQDVPGSAGARSEVGVTFREVDELLAGPRHGRAALRQLGGALDVAAQRNSLEPAELTTLLRTDRTAWLDSHGRLYYIEPEVPAAQRRAPSTSVSATPLAPLSDTFLLHSRPGATKVVHLDFDGATVSGTAWNSQDGVGTSHPAWDPAGNGATFTDGEKTSIQQVWAIVAEDFAPWDVDVTTEDPGVAGIVRSSVADESYGTHALITPSDDAYFKICGGGCGGVAYVDVFDQVNSPYQPAWVFPQRTGDAAKSIAEATTHEVGHNLGLSHDGTSGTSYYAGHSNWAPIMGSGLKPVIQWSNGDYSNATSPDQDDLALITDTNPHTFAGGLSLVADEAGSTVATAAGSLPSSGAIITSRTDKDVFALGTCTGPVAVTASPAPVSPNLDISLDLLDAGGSVLDTDDPTSDFGDGSTAGGMGATVSITDGAGRSLFVRVDGVGTGSVDTGYDDYGSIGHYTLDVTCEGGGSTAEAPGAVTGLSASSSAPTSATATWSAPADDGGSSITGYHVSLAGGGTTLVSAGTTSHTFTGLSPETTYTVQVAAVNAEGDGPTSSTQVTTQADEVVEPTDPLAGPKITKGSYNRRGTKLTLKWAPVDDAAGYVVVFTNRRGKVMDFFDQGQRTRGRVAMRKVSKKARFVQMVAYDLDGNIGDYGKRWRL